ncbi:MAG: HEPN domain-containing protein [Nitrososphaerales archaeon]
MREHIFAKPKLGLKTPRKLFRSVITPYTVRLSQECVELSLKAVLKAVGIEYPKIHDVSDVMLLVEDRFPSWFREEIGFLIESSKILVKKREISLYGGEESFLTPEEVINARDAEDAVKRADKTYHLCERLVAEIERKQESEDN